MCRMLAGTTYNPTNRGYSQKSKQKRKEGQISARGFTNTAIVLKRGQDKNHPGHWHAVCLLKKVSVLLWITEPLKSYKKEDAARLLYGFIPGQAHGQNWHSGFIKQSTP